MRSYEGLNECVYLFWFFVNFVQTADRGDQEQALHWARGLSPEKLAWLFCIMPRVGLGKLPGTLRRGRIYSPIGTITWQWRTIAKTPTLFLRRDHRRFLTLIDKGGRWHATLYTYSDSVVTMIATHWGREE